MKKPPQIQLLAGGDDDAPAPGPNVLAAEVPFLGRRLTLRVSAPDGRATLADVVPLARSLCDLFGERVVRHVEAAGREITCAKGCCFCCTNHLVPMSVPEAFRLAEDLGALPAPERRRLAAGFEQAAARLAASGLEEDCAKLDPDDPDSIARQRELAGRWWSQQRSACPLLIDGACTQYLIRPMACREFLVVSPPQRCAENAESRVRRPFAMHAVLAAWAAELEAARPTLVLMPNLLPWTDGKVSRARRTWRSPGMVRRFLDVLKGMAERAAEGFGSGLDDGASPPPERK